MTPTVVNAPPAKPAAKAAPTPTEVAKAAQAAAPAVEPPKPAGSGSVSRDKVAPASVLKPAVTAKHQCQSFKLAHQRFNFLVECPDCHWQARVMTEAEVEHAISNHAAHKAAQRPF